MKLSSRKLVTCVCLLFLTSCSLYESIKLQHHNQTNTHKIEGNDLEISIPFTWYNGHMIMHSKVNGANARLVFDTGAPVPVLFESGRTHSLDLKEMGSIKVGGTGDGDRVEVNVIGGVNVELSNLFIEDLRMVHVPASELNLFANYEETYFDGAIGFELMSRYRIKIDSDKQVMTLTPKHIVLSKNKLIDEGWQPVPIVVEGADLFLDTNVTYDGHQHSDVRLLIDTGSSGTFSLVPSSHSSLTQPKQAYYESGTGLQGESKYAVAMVENLHFGGVVLETVPAAFNLNDDIEKARNGILGNRLLRKFNLIIDLENKLIFAKPNHFFEQQIGLDRSGLRVLPHEKGAVVQSVAPDSYAQKLGLQTKDIIVSFNDADVNITTFDAFRELLSSQNEKIRLCWTSESSLHEQTECHSLPLVDRI